MEEYLEFFILLLKQFAGGPGPAENNLVRFGLPALMWVVLFYIAWSRRKSPMAVRENLLVWGFGLAALREIYMFSQMVRKLLDTTGYEASCKVVQPFEHALAMAAMIVVSGAFLRYLLDDKRVSGNYLKVGAAATLLGFGFASITWPGQMAADPQILFHQTKSAWLFHVPLSLLMGLSVILMLRQTGWTRNVVAVALTLEFFSEILLLGNYATDQAYNQIICPFGNAMHILAIPLFGFVYLREQSLEKKHAEEALSAYRDHLEELVNQRTIELTRVNKHLENEVLERARAEQALAKISRRYEWVLESAGEGVCGIDRQGLFLFVNPAAAKMLGYRAADLIDRPCYPVWHPDDTDRPIHSVAECPISAGYREGRQRFGDDEYFSRRDGSTFPVRYFSNPTWEDNELTGAVVVFQDITERKRNEQEIAQRNASLATQNAVAATLSRSMEIDRNMLDVLDMVRRETGMEIGLIYLKDPVTGELKLHLWSGFEAGDRLDEIISESCACMHTIELAMEQSEAIMLNLDEHPVSNVSDGLSRTGIRRLISFPMTSKGRSIGVVSLGSRVPSSLQLHKQEMMIAICQQIGMAVENTRLYLEADMRGDQLIRLNQASSRLTASIHLNQVLVEIARQSAWLTGCQKSCVIRISNSGQSVELAAHYGLRRDDLKVVQAEMPVWELLHILSEQPYTVMIHEDFVDTLLPEGIRNQLEVERALILPVWRSDHPREFIFLVDTKNTRKWKPADLEIYESLANRAAIVLSNAHLHRQIELSAALEERQRIAANMHDGLAQTLSLLGLGVDQTQELIENGCLHDASMSMRKIRETVSSATIEVRSSIASLQQAPRPPNSLQTLIHEVISRHQTIDAPNLHFSAQPESEDLYIPPHEADHVMSIIQEAILNACRHSKAQHVSVHLSDHGEEICVSVEDNGCGFDLLAANLKNDHFGLKIMQARAARISGTLEIDSSPGQGTSVRLTWPVGKGHSAGYENLYPKFNRQPDLQGKER